MLISDQCWKSPWKCSVCHVWSDVYITLYNTDLPTRCKISVTFAMDTTRNDVWNILQHKVIKFLVIE